MKKIVPLILLACALAGVALVLLQNRAEQQAPLSAAAKLKPEQADLAALKSKAQSGDPAAQTSLGWVYEKGAGVKPDMKEAVKWFQAAANQNHPEALTALGEMTQAGQGTKADLKEAARLYRLAAEKGNVAGQYNLAYLYDQGSGVAKDETEAAKWYQLAAEGGDPIAQFDIGQLYKLGLGVKSDRVQAFKWFALSAAQGQPDSARMLQDLKSNMSAAEIATAKKLVKEFVPRHPGHAGQPAS